jgi:hypothetical protein
MKDAPQAGGDIITYRDTSDTGPGEFRRALLTNISIVDPETGTSWVAIIAADQGLTLLDPELIVDSAHTRAEGTPVQVDVLGAALAVLSSDLTELDGPSAQEALTRFLTVLAPMERRLSALADDDPSGPLGTVLRCVARAAEHFARGQHAEGKAGILLANALMAGVVESGP